ncbi:MAG: hypothetical protein EOS21_32150 [Mesorhizobium sp.]|nr:MAG: hypothetical protein EOS21_32150 [Mesorhizobium sp.]
MELYGQNGLMCVKKHPASEAVMMDPIFGGEVQTIFYDVWPLRVALIERSIRIGGNDVLLAPV